MGNCPFFGDEKATEDCPSDLITLKAGLFQICLSIWRFVVSAADHFCCSDNIFTCIKIYSPDHLTCKA